MKTQLSCQTRRPRRGPWGNILHDRSQGQGDIARRANARPAARLVVPHSKILCSSYRVETHVGRKGEIAEAFGRKPRCEQPDDEDMLNRAQVADKITFVDLDPDSLDIDQKDTPELAQVSALLNRRIGVSAGVTDLRWASHFVMHKRIARRLADGRRFLMGDAAHLSSPIAGEGLNSALMDAADIAWKLALVVRGAALRTLLDTYEIERQLADRRVLEVSDMLHRRALGLATAPAASPEPPPDPAHALALARALGRCSTFPMRAALSSASTSDRPPRRPPQFPGLAPASASRIASASPARSTICCFSGQSPYPIRFGTAGNISSQSHLVQISTSPAPACTRTVLFSCARTASSVTDSRKQTKAASPRSMPISRPISYLLVLERRGNRRMAKDVGEGPPAATIGFIGVFNV
jgi:FAD binding domain